MVIRKKTNALHILDRLHTMAHINKAIDEVRAQEARTLKEKGLGPVLTTKSLVAANKPKNPTDNQK